MTWAATAACCLILLPVLVIGAASGGVEIAQPSSSALADIPPDYLALYQEAGTEVGVPWELLAAIGKVECDHGRDPACQHPNSAGAAGPMQFLPATFNQYSFASGNPNPSIDDPRDAIYAAAALLADNDVRDNPRQALYAYNHSTAYVDQVLAWAATYQADAASSAISSATTAAPHAVAAAAVSYALAQLGTSYLWGGERPGGFDCSGLVQAAYASAGIQLPRTAQAQYDAGPRVPAGVPLQPGDLVFFGSDTAHVEHVGICRSCQVDHVGIVVDDHGDMIDAPHTGAVVRIEPYTTWPNFIGATRPSLLATGSASGG